ncbi:MAG TPA: alpha/beta hydrolase [Solirubrobacteraceae bacterium]|nr:alpha/beta hydrolase [Solirubrobacteraceae bacterium]
MPKLTLANGLRVHYQQVGEGPDLVMVHGLTGNLAVWHLRIVSELSERFRVLTYDLRGHGLTEAPPSGYTPDAMAQDLLELLDALEIERPLIAGHSYGADIALYHALAHPERVSEVIAIEAALPALEESRRHDGWVGWSYWVKALEEAGREVPADKRSDLRYMIRATIDLPKQWGPLKGLPRNPKPLLRLVDETTLPQDYRQVGTLTLDRVASIQTPVVLIYTERSAFIDTFDFLSESLPNVHPVLMPRTEWGHFGPMEQPERVAREIAARRPPVEDPAPAVESAG